MDTSRTAALLRQALDICRSTTGRQDVGDELLAEVFRSLRLEQMLGSEELDDCLDDDLPAPGVRH